MSSEKKYTDRELYEQVKDLDFALLLSGLTVLVKDTMTYLTEEGIESLRAEEFRQTYLYWLNDSRYYRERFTPELYDSLEDCALTEDMEGIVEKIANSKSDLELLTNSKLGNKEWLRSSGWAFFQTYSGLRRADILGGLPLKEFKKAICENRDPYKSKTENDGRDSKKQEQICEKNDPFMPVNAIIEKLIGTEKQWTKYWFPLMLYIVLLLQKTDYTTLGDIV